MSVKRYTKINQLERDLPEGLIVDAAWLERKGYYGSLRQKYVAAGWLEQPARSVYRRPRGELTWEQVLISLQTLMHLPVSVGGRTALELQGFAHYLSMSPREVHLYTDKPLPGWVVKTPVDNYYNVHNRKRLFPVVPDSPTGHSVSESDIQTVEHPEVLPGALRVLPWGQWRWPLVVSTPERAFLELLDELPGRESFHQVDMLAESLASLSPLRLQELLRDCRSIKVKRLFFFFADRHDHRWLHKINRKEIDLGKGKRLLVKGGTLDSTYQITVPVDLDGF